MATNQINDKPQLSVAVTNPVAVVSGNPCRFGNMTGVALDSKGQGGNASGNTSVDFGWGVWSLSVTDTVGGGIAVGDTLFYADGAPGTINNTSTNYFFGFALATVGAGQTATINVVHAPSPGAGSIGAGTVGTAQLAAGALSADAAGRGKFAGDFFDAATVLAKFATDSFLNAELLKLVADGAFQADAATRALFADAIWTMAKLAPNSMDGTIAANVADVNVIGGIPVVHRIACADGAGNTDVVLTHKTIITDVQVIKTGGAGAGGNSVKLTNVASGNDITDAIATTGGDKTVTRAGTIDDAEFTIAAGGTLRATVAKGGGNAACLVIVRGFRSA